MTWENFEKLWLPACCRIRKQMDLSFAQPSVRTVSCKCSCTAVPCSIYFLYTCALRGKPAGWIATRQHSTVVNIATQLCFSYLMCSARTTQILWKLPGRSIMCGKFDLLSTWQKSSLCWIAMRTAVRTSMHFKNSTNLLKKYKLILVLFFVIFFFMCSVMLPLYALLLYTV